ncbi:polysaccharide deacetylase family protein [Bifidobacterium gallicum]|nr:polysaccharide deacetylase family protein [Bifidobacterium gallicum]KFI60043.1 polysaccharide deacetylase [Bifidobacterium gallicum DSM 20093 = LMG 11596]
MTQADSNQGQEPEEISLEGIARPPKKPRSNVAFALISVLIAVVVVGLGIGLWWMWQFHWRSINVQVDGTSYAIKADTSVAQLLKDHDDFRRTPGNLLAVDGKLLEKAKGNPVTVSVEGKAVAPQDWDSTHMTDGDTISVTDGTDATEPHTVGTEPIPFGTNIDLTQGAIQLVEHEGKDGVAQTWTGTISKKTVRKEELEKPVDLKVVSFNVSPAGKKIVALTFDDGPSPYTTKILNILKDKHVKATFFDVGEDALIYPQIEKQTVADGNQVASHSATHAYLPDLDRTALRKELETGFADIEKASGVKTDVLRAPYGSFGIKQWKETADMVKMNVLWNIDTEDWKKPGADAIRKTVRSNMFNGAVVLMHAGGGERDQTVEALPHIIDDLKADGYTFVTIDEYVAMR